MHRLDGRPRFGHWMLLPPLLPNRIAKRLCNTIIHDKTLKRCTINYVMQDHTSRWPKALPHARYAEGISNSTFKWYSPLRFLHWVPFFGSKLLSFLISYSYCKCCLKLFSFFDSTFFLNCNHIFFLIQRIITSQSFLTLI